LGFAVGGLLVGYYRGKAFLFSMAGIGLLCLIIFPQVIPDSITARMGDLVGNTEQSESWAPKEESLDKSSSTRIDMWMGALKMMEESPFFGKGFKSFEYPVCICTSVLKWERRRCCCLFFFYTICFR